jgi:2-polyprenyl-6-methoxyphenol hydroxylase-like FAD-dependent oxidoreductase
MNSSISNKRYDVIIAGARCAGASTAMLMARLGLRVLVVDPMQRGSDTLSTHALMRGAVFQLHKWGLLDDIRSAGTPVIQSTTFHYGEEVITLPIKKRDDIDGLYAPRRTVLDSILIDAAEAAGAEIHFGHSVVDLLRDGKGHVYGAVVADQKGNSTTIEAELVVGADGLRSRVARILKAEVTFSARHATASIYSHRKNIGLDGFHWFYNVGAAVGAIPTNDGDTCVFASLPPARFEQHRGSGLETLYQDVLNDVSPELARTVAASAHSGKVRAFPGQPGFLRKSAGPGWALVGDAGYFKDPLTAHGITDAFRDAELLAEAMACGGGHKLSGYEEERDELVRGLLEVTDRIASFEWDLDEVKVHHLDLSREMNREVDFLRSREGTLPGIPGPTAMSIGPIKGEASWQ